MSINYRRRGIQSMNENRMNVLIVIPKFVRRKNEFYDMPLGLAYISSYLKSSGYSVFALNMNHYVEETEFDVLADYLQNNDIDAVLTGGLSAFFLAINNIISSVKKIAPEIVTILGGGIVTSDKVTVCNELLPHFAVLGEGEITVKELLDALKEKREYKEIHGIGYKEDGEYRFTPERAAIDDLDMLPNPDYEIFGLDDFFQRQNPLCGHLWVLDFPRVLPIVTSRSCPLDCTFCFHPVGKKYRMRSLDRVFEEIEEMVETHNINIIAVLDEMMSASKKRLLEFAQRIKKYNVLWGCQLWPGTVDDDTLKIMKDSGFYLVSYGLESLNDDVLISMKKFGVTRAKIEASLKQAKEHKVTIQGNFIFGDPAETVETSNETLAWWKEHTEYQINLGRIAPYPGTPLYDYAIEKGIIKDRAAFIRAGTPSLNLTQMDADQYAALLSKMATYSAQGRHYATVKSITRDHRTEHESYLCDIECPHCHDTVAYGNMIVSKVEVFKMGCRSCFLRFDVNPSVFPNLQKQMSEQKSEILRLHEKHGSIIISPAILEDRFLEYFDLVGIDHNSLQIKMIIDNNETRVGKKYLGKYDIFLREQSSVDRLENPAVLIMMSLYRDEIIKQFTELGISPDAIFSVEQKTGLFDLEPSMATH